MLMRPGPHRSAAARPPGSRRVWRGRRAIRAASRFPNPVMVPGPTLHEELALFVRAGLTPIEALRTATVNPALFLGMADSLGTIEPGKLAELVLLDANPLEDIRNTTRIHAVVRGGRYLDRAALDALLAGLTRRPGAR